MNRKHPPGTRRWGIALAMLMALGASMAGAETIGRVEVRSVSPRDVAADPGDIFDKVASGLSVVGVGTKVYLEVEALHGFAVGGGNWELISQPGGSMTDLSASSGILVTLSPDHPGLYIIRLTPLDTGMQPTDPVEQRIYAGNWVGAGVFNTEATPDSTIPHCGNTCCHSESDQPRLNVVESWLDTKHAQTLQAHLNGERGDHTSQSCLPCHSLGFDTMAVNNGFDDIANALGWDLGQIATLVQDAVANGNDNFHLLPTELQSHASVQCEACHGPGSQHMGFITEPDHGIAGVNLDTKQCAQCHDSASGFQQGFYQWSASSHPVTAELSEGHVADTASCVKCHTGEGFVSVTINGEAAAPVPNAHGITCAACHDPHGTDFEHELRFAGAATLGSGVVLEDAGNGGLCAQCHQSRIANAETSALTSSRGAHYGPQADMLTGSGAVSFDLTWVGNSAHTTITDNTCTTCHMAETPGGGPGITETDLVGGHTYAIRDDMGTPDPSDDVVNAANACGVCHGELMDTIERESRGDYDGDGIIESTQDEVRGLFDILRPQILATMAGTSVSASTGKIEITTGNFNLLSADQKRALYNYNFVWLDGSYGVHNTSYAIQALQRAYYGAFGHTILDDYPNIDLRGPVQPSIIPTPTPSPTPIPTPTPTPPPVLDYLAEVELLGVSPRQVSLDMTGTFDERSAGLHNVGVGEKVYLEAVKIDDSVIGYTWGFFSKPATSTATLSSTTGEMVTFRPDVKGTYIIRLTPLTSGREVIDVFDQRIYAAEYAGAGVFDTHDDPDPRAPECGTSFCHGGNNGNADLNVLDDWLKSNHSKTLQLHLSGERGDHLNVSCLPCHTVGFNDHMQAVNGGFDDWANTLGFDLGQIATLVQDAVANNHDNFPVLPAQLQDHSSVQCESCHGAGSLHAANLTAIDKGIAGANLDTKQCAQCHDSASGFQQGFYQWSSSTHPVTDELSEGHVAEQASCLPCHTGEGFIAARVRGETPQVIHEPHGITCAVCHDPHGSDNKHQLRVAGDFVIPSGQRPFGTGTGGVCWRCHNSRIADAEATSLSSSRGAHYGTQGDMLLGATGVSFGLPFEANSPHGVVVDRSCSGCHMAETPGGGPGVIETPLVGGHTYSMRDTMGTPDIGDDIINVENACARCHQGLDTYDYPTDGDYDGDGTVEGVQAEVEGLFNILKPGILATMPGTSIGSNGRVSISTASFNLLTADQKRAIYNYNFVWSDGSLGVHNTSYAVQLLQRSYFGVFGRSILEDYPNIDLRGPVQDPGGARVEGWISF